MNDHTHPELRDDVAIGDCASCPQPGGPGPVPPRAQAAHEEAAHMVRQIERKLRGGTLLPFRYRDFGSLVSLGGHTTVGSLMGFLFRSRHVHRRVVRPVDLPRSLHGPRASVERQPQRDRGPTGTCVVTTNRAGGEVALAVDIGGVMT